MLECRKKKRISIEFEYIHNIYFIKMSFREISTDANDFDKINLQNLLQVLYLMDKNFAKPQSCILVREHSRCNVIKVMKTSLRK